MKAMGKEQKKQWVWKLAIPVFLAAFFSVASSGGLSAKSVYGHMADFVTEQFGYLAAKTCLPLLSYDSSGGGRTFLEYMADGMEQLLPIYGYARKKNQGYSSSQAVFGAYAEQSCSGGEDSLPQDLFEIENEKEREVLAKKEGEAEDVPASHAASGKVQTYSIQKLRDFDYLLQNFYRVDSTTTTNSSQLNVDKLLAEDMSLDASGEDPQILIYHTHSQERFADSKDGQSVVGLGNILTKLLEEKGYSVLHHTGTYDLPDRDTAYSRSAPALEQILKENPQIQVIIDLHRDGVAEQTRLVGKVNGKDTATIMFFNGLSHTTAQGDIAYLKNTNLDGNLAFSFQMQLAAAEYYPGFSRCIYLRGYRYNLHYRPKSLLVEVGAQTNTWQEVVNAMDPLADILDKVLSGKAKESTVE